MTSAAQIPRQVPVSWHTALVVSWAGLRRRLLRSLITAIGVVLAIAMLTYMLSTESVTAALVRAAGDDGGLFNLLQEKGVDVVSAGGVDSMMVLLLGLALLTSTVGIVNSMLMSVTERVREIGTLKCLGASDPFIVKIYLIESAIQSILGCLVGMGLGLVVALAVAVESYGGYALRFFPAGPVIRSMGLSFSIGTAISIVAAIGPAYAAARKQPVEALRVQE